METVKKNPRGSEMGKERNKGTEEGLTLGLVR